MLLVPLVLALGSGAAGASDPTASDAATTECRLGLVSIELGDREYSTTSEIAASREAWLCSPPDADADDTDGGILLFGDEVDNLTEAHSGQLVRIYDDDDGGTALVPIGDWDVGGAANRTNATSSNSSAVDCARGRTNTTDGTNSTVDIQAMAFGGERPARPTRFVDSPDAEGTRGRRLAGRASGARRAGGAQRVDRTAAHGSRNMLSVIVGVADAGSSRATWPKGCSVGAVREAMWGTPSGTAFTVGASPWAVSKDVCRRSGSCRFAVADHLRHTSRGAVTFERAQSREIDLGTVRGYPADFCNWRAIWTAIKNALRAKGLSVDSFRNVVAYVPKHCSVAMGNLPGKFVIANYCPRSGVRENAPSVLAHELGHNLGLGHAGKQGGGEYDDRSSIMGASQAGRSMTLSMAHRHMFGWLSGLPRSVLTDTDVDAPPIDRTRQVKLADPNSAALPAGAKWAVEVHDGARSWYVAYRGCTAYDSNAPDGWCGVVQVSFRDNGKVTASHVVNLKTAGQQATFGSSDHITVRTPSSIPDRLAGRGTVTVSVRVFRGNGRAGPAPSPAPIRWPGLGTVLRCRRTADEGACARDRACRWKRWRRTCAPRFPRPQVARSLPSPATRRRCQQTNHRLGCLMDRNCRWKRWRKQCAPKLPN